MEKEVKQPVYINATPKSLEVIKGINLTNLDAQLKAAGIQLEGMNPVYIPERNNLSIGISETKDVLLFGVNLVKAVILKDTPAINRWLAVMTTLPGMIVGIELVPSEISDLQEDELQELVVFVIENLPGTTPEKALIIVEHSIKAAYHIWKIVEANLPTETVEVEEEEKKEETE